MSDSVRLKRGDTLLLKWVFRDATGSLVDLTGCVAALDIVNRRKQVVASLTSAGGLSVQPIDADGEHIGEVWMRVEAAVTTLWAPGEYQTDLEVLYPDACVQSTPTLTLYVDEDITR
jgi:hypothetical protein